MVTVTYNHLNGCKCPNWACSREEGEFVCSNLNQSRWRNALDTASYLMCPSSLNDFCPLSLSGCSLSAICAVVRSLFVCEGVRRGIKTVTLNNEGLFSHASSDNSGAPPQHTAPHCGRPWHNSDKNVLPERKLFLNHSFSFFMRHSSYTVIRYADRLM